MSTTDIYGFRKSDHLAELCTSIPNAWSGAMAIWAAIEEKYLPPYIPDHVKYCNWYRPGMSFDEIVRHNGYKPTRCTTMTFYPKDSPIKEVWALADTDKLSIEDRIALSSTFDHALVRADYVPEVIAAFRKADLEGANLKEQADVLEELLKSGKYIAFGWGSSLCASDWEDFAQDEDGNSVPYNCETGTKHWWISQYTMRVPFGEIQQVGDLYYYRTYLFYEEPQIFSCVDADGRLYLAVSEPSAEGTDCWLLVQLSKERLAAAETNEVDIRSRFTASEGNLWRVVRAGEKFSAETVDAASLSDDVLPTAGMRLDFKGEKA